MLLTLLVILVLIAVLTWAWQRRGSIPTPIPRHIARRGREIKTEGPWWLTPYRLSLVVFVIILGGVALIVNPGGLLAFFVAGVMIWVFMEDIQLTLLDLWNARFYSIRTPRLRRWRS